MKKLALALVASTVTLSAANANISTGFYLGAHAGYGSLTGKLSGNAAGGGALNNGSSDFGSGFGNIGIHGGYGWVTGCLYLGGELSYTFENAKATSTLVGNGTVQLKRNGYARAALRGGYLFTPNTMGYIALGANWGKYTLNDNSLFFTNANPGSGSKNRLSFAPGVGLETAVHRNVYLRVEYNYEFGPSVRATNSALPNNFTNAGTVRSQTGKVGLSYKF